MKRTFTEKNNEFIATHLISLNGYIVHVNTITKNNGNDNNHYSFLLSLEDQSTVRIMKYLSKIPSCSLYNRLRNSLTNGEGVSINYLREQNEQYTCTLKTKVVQKELGFHQILYV